MCKQILILIILLPLCSCAVAMSARRSTAKGDPAIIQVGASRAIIEETFGSPNMSASLDGRKTRVIYKIDPNAHSTGARNAAVAQDKYTNYVIIYNKTNKVESVETIK